MKKSRWLNLTEASLQMLVRARNSINYRSRKALRRRPNEESEEATFEICRQDDLEQFKLFLDAMERVSLQSFLTTNATIEIPHQDNPEVSIILVLHNRAELTLNCLHSIVKSGSDPYEIIIVDNVSTDETAALLSRIRGATIIKNTTKTSGPLACNQASQLARGSYLLLLNHAAQVLPGSIASALGTIKSSKDIGAAGGKIVLPDGTLHQAGGIIWQNGTRQGYGQGDSPFAPMYMYAREVDCCSADFILTPHDTFIDSGRFDDFELAAEWAADYCIRLQRAGKSVVYDPRTVILRTASASSRSKEDSFDPPLENQLTVLEEHKDWLQFQYPAAARNILRARSSRKHRERILFIEDRVPHPHLGAGYPRTKFLLSEMVSLGYFVTFYPLTVPCEDWASAYESIPQEVEVMLNYGPSRLGQFLKEREGYYDLIFVSRPHNMATLKRSLSNIKSHKIVYDAEALFCLRNIERLRLKGEELSPKDAQKLIRKEVKLAEGCHSVISVSEVESRRFTDHGFGRVYTLGHALEPRPTQNSYELRENILFVGPVDKPGSPNVDSVTWFIEKIFPIIQKQLGKELKFFVVGANNPDLVSRLAGESIDFLGRVDDLTHLYNTARLFIAPTRFAAGIPIKIYEAASYGLPVVATSLITTQIGWRDQIELLVADEVEGFATACIRLYQDPVLWNTLRSNALDRVGVDCSPQRLSGQLKSIIGEALGS